MKVNIKGKVGKQELLETFAKTLNSLEDAGVNEFSGVNLYFNAYLSGKKVIPQLSGESFEVEVKSKESHIEVNVLEGGLSTLSYKTGIKSQDLDLDGRLNLNLPIELPIEATLLAERKLRIEEQRKDSLERQAEAEAIREQHSADFAAEKSRSLECIQILCGKLGISADEFKLRVSSVGWMVSKGRIRKYTDKEFDGKAFRISLHIDGTKDKKIYLFSEALDLVFES